MFINYELSACCFIDSKAFSVPLRICFLIIPVNIPANPPILTSQLASSIAYKERTDKGIYAVSVRGSPSCKTHLGKLVSTVSSELGGSGGGHDKACGAVIPKDKIKKFVREMNLRLGNR